MVLYGMKWLEASFLKPETVVLFFTSQTLRNGRETGYGMGWFTGTDAQGKTIVWHTGGSVGGRAVLVLIPDEDIVVAMLSNAGWAPMSRDNGLRVVAPFRALR
jgi:serine beta-lactamase-like protein LACTB